MIDLSKQFDSPPAYRKRLSFYVEKTDAAYRLGAAVKMLELARRELTSPRKRLSVARDALAVLEGHLPAPQVLPLGAQSSALILSDLQRYLSANDQAESAQTKELQNLVDTVASQTAWANFKQFEASSFGQQPFDLNAHPDLQPAYDEWFQVALGYLGTELPTDQDEAVTELKRRIEFLLSKVAPASDDRYGLRDRYDALAYRFARTLMNDWDRAGAMAA